MSTSNLSHTAPLVADPTRLPLFARVSAPLHGVKNLLIQAFEKQEPSEQTYQPLLGTPLRFTRKSIYTPLQEGNGYR